MNFSFLFRLIFTSTLLSVATNIFADSTNSAKNEKKYNLLMSAGPIYNTYQTINKDFTGDQHKSNIYSVIHYNSSVNWGFAVDLKYRSINKILLNPILSLQYRNAILIEKHRNLELKSDPYAPGGDSTYFTSREGIIINNVNLGAGFSHELFNLKKVLFLICPQIKATYTTIRFSKTPINHNAVSASFDLHATGCGYSIALEMLLPWRNNISLLNEIGIDGEFTTALTNNTGLVWRWTNANNVALSLKTGISFNK